MSKTKTISENAKKLNPIVFGQHRSTRAHTKGLIYEWDRLVSRPQSSFDYFISRLTGLSVEIWTSGQMPSTWPILISKAVPRRKTEWEASWACVITGNLLRLSKEVSGLSACVIFSIQKSNHCSMAVRVIEVTLCARYGVFQAFKLSRMFICEVSCAHRRWFIMHLPEHEAIWSVRPSLH